MDRWASELSARGLKAAIRRAVDQSARHARKETIQVIADDIGVPKARIRAATPKVQTTRAGDLSARWTVTKLRIPIKDVGGKIVAGHLEAATHRIGGGGSSHLRIANAFIVHGSKGGMFLAYRRGKSRLPIKAPYAEHPGTALGQNNSPAQTKWKSVANRELSTRLTVEISKQLVAEGLGPHTPDVGD
jgi:hypothetical protein